VIASGDVSIWHVQADGLHPTAPSVQFGTSEQGVFTGQITATTGQRLYLEVRGRADGSSRMYCDLVDCGTAFNVELDTNSNGRVDFGEWLEIDEQTFLSAYTEYQNADVPIRLNLLTHLVSQSFSSGPTTEVLEAAYSELQQFLQLTTSPDDIPPFTVTGNSTMTADQIQDNAVMQGLLSELANTSDVAQAILTTSELYSSEVGFDASTVSLANVSSLAIQLTAILIEQAPEGTLSEEVKTSVNTQLAMLNQQASETENKLAADDLPTLPPIL
jgi:hypothetical protein